MQQSARFYGFFQNTPTKQPRAPVEEDSSHAVDEAYHLCEKVVSRLQTLDEEESYQLALRCKPLGFVLVDLPIEPESLRRCFSKEFNELQGNHSNIYGQLSVDMLESTLGKQLRKIAAQLDAEMGTVDGFREHLQSPISENTCLTNMVSNNGLETECHNCDLQSPHYSIDSSEQRLPRTQNGGSMLSPSDDCEPPMFETVDRVFQFATDTDVIPGCSGQIGVGRENIGFAMDILEGEGENVKFSFSRSQSASPAASSSSEGPVLMNFSAHRGQSVSLISSLENTADYQGYEVSSPGNYCTGPAVDEIYAFDFPDIAVSSQIDDLADTDDEVIRSPTNYSVARQCSANAGPSGTFGCRQAECNQMHTDGRVPSTLISLQNTPTGDVCNSDSDILNSSLRAHPTGTPGCHLSSTGSPTPSQYSVCLGMTAQSSSASNSRLREDEWELQAVNLMNRHYTHIVLKQGRLRSVISVSHAIIRTDLDELVQYHILSWQFQNPWSQRSCHQYSGNDPLMHQLLCELNWVEIETDSDTNLIRRRFSLMRLFHYYNHLRTDSLPGLGRGKDNRTKALNFILKLYYPDWETRPSMQSKRRERLRKNIDQGRRWCSLAQYLGYCVALSSSADMDKFMSNKNVNEVDIHALATFAINVYPDGLEICGALNSTAVDILNRNNPHINIDLGMWRNGHRLFSNTRNDPLRLSPSGWKEVPLSKSCHLSGVLCADRA